MEGEFMLIFSYILAASLEGALTYMVYTATGEIPLLYALLFASFSRDNRRIYIFSVVLL